MRVVMPGAVIGGEDFPEIVNSATTTDNSISNGHALNLPASIVAGNLLVMIWKGGGTNQTPTGWDKLDQVTGTGNGFLCVTVRTASGAEGATETFNFQSGNTGPCCAICYQIRRWSDVEADCGAGAIGGNPDPPSFSPSWGQRKTLWLAAGYGIRLGTTSMSVSAYPSGYSGGLNAPASQGLPAARHLIASAHLENRAATENPGAYTFSPVPDDIQAAATIAVRPL